MPGYEEEEGAGVCVGGGGAAIWQDIDIVILYEGHCCPCLILRSCWEGRSVCFLEKMESVAEPYAVDF